LQRILPKRPDFRLVITSATIDTARFAEHFSTPQRPVPIIDVEGRTYPVEIRYQPPPTDREGREESESDEHIVDSIRELAGGDNGDMLVFLPTENEIRSVHKKLRSVPLPGKQTEVLPLYARLSTAQQNEVFSPGSRRRIVLATNVAESSITVPRIRFVVDTGTARISHYSPRSKVQRLPIQAVSQASADQRAGRCGRIGPGICVRLYSQEDFDSRPKFTTPEIRRTNLASVILRTLALKLGKIEEFPFIDPPRPESIRDGFKTLFELGAIDGHRRLTELGRRLARLPVDPRVGRMLYAADQENCLAEVLIIVSALEIQDPRVRPAEKKKSADAAHEKFTHEKSDFLTLLNIWDFFHQLKSDLSKSKLRLACEQNFLSFSLLRQWQDIHRQLAAMITVQGLKPRKHLIPSRDVGFERSDSRDPKPRRPTNRPPNQSTPANHDSDFANQDYGAIHRSLLAGLLSGIALLGDRHEYTGAGGIQFHLWPGSGIFQSKPKWIMAAEVVETSRRYGRTVARIAPEWIEPLAGHLIKSRYSDPVWSKKQQAVTASEHVSLWGLPIVSGRSVNYGRIDPEAARSMFIQEALTHDGLVGHFDFLEHNRWVAEQIQSEASKTRRRDLIVDSHTVESFYEDRLPSDVCDKVSLSQKLKKSADVDQNLRMTRADLLPQSGFAEGAELFPDQVKIGSMNIPIQYRFAPGEVDDGATVKLPVAGIGQLDDVQSGWLVPGLLESRILALIRSLPKALRRNLVPAPETAKQVVQEIEFGQGNFFETVARHLSQKGGEPISSKDFDSKKIDEHLIVNLQIVDDEGTVIAQGRSVAEIRSQLGASHVSSIVEVEDKTWQQNGLTAWSWGDLPKEISINRGGTQLMAFPTIVDQQEGVGLRLADSRAASDLQTRAGLVRLYHFRNRKSIKSQIQWLPDLDRHSIALARVMPSTDIKPQLGDLITRIAFVDRMPIPRSEVEFEERQSNSAERIGIGTQDVAKWLPKFASNLHRFQLGWGELPPRFEFLKQDLQLQLNGLVTENFLVTTPWPWLVHLPRYFEAMIYRMEKCTSTDASKDRAATELVASYWQKFEQATDFQARQAIVDPELETFRWMIEEYRVSLFAQSLGTSVKISDARLDKQWKKVRAG
jgi:ATP-dependent helicase HrpA